MTAQDIFEELRFVLELLAVELAFLLPFAQTKQHFPLRAGVGIAAFCGISLGYFPLLEWASANLSDVRWVVLAWYILLTLLTVVFVRGCFYLSASDALYMCIAGYAAQHIIYIFLHELLALYLWTELPGHLPLYVLLATAGTALMFLLVSKIFGPHLRECGGRMFADTPYNIAVHVALLTILIICTFSGQHIFQTVEGGQLLGGRIGLMVCLLILGIQYVSLRAVRAGQERATIEQMLRDSAGQYSLTREMVEHINRTCHDLKHNLQVLKTIDETERQEYIEQTERDIALYHELVHTEDEALNTVLASKCLYCDNRDIRLTCAVDGGDLSFLSVPDLYALLGNAIDNAVECVEKFDEAEKRFISLTIRGQGGFVCIQTNNYCDAPLTLREGLPVTTKADTSSHGFGLKSIRYLAEKYGGSICVSVEDNIFILQIMLPVPQR